MGGWSCPHFKCGKCVRRNAPTCVPGATNCILDGKAKVTAPPAGQKSSDENGPYCRIPDNKPRKY